MAATGALAVKAGAAATAMYVSSGVSPAVPVVLGPRLWWAGCGRCGRRPLPRGGGHSGCCAAAAAGDNNKCNRGSSCALFKTFVRFAHKQPLLPCRHHNRITATQNNNGF